MSPNPNTPPTTGPEVPVVDPGQEQAEVAVRTAEELQALINEQAGQTGINTAPIVVNTAEQIAEDVSAQERQAEQDRLLGEQTRIAQGIANAEEEAARQQQMQEDYIRGRDDRLAEEAAAAAAGTPQVNPSSNPTIAPTPPAAPVLSPNNPENNEQDLEIPNTVVLTNPDRINQVLAGMNVHEGSTLLDLIKEGSGSLEVEDKIAVLRVIADTEEYPTAGFNNLLTSLIRYFEVQNEDPLNTNLRNPDNEAKFDNLLNQLSIAARVLDAASPHDVLDAYDDTREGFLGGLSWAAERFARMGGVGQLATVGIISGAIYWLKGKAWATTAAKWIGGGLATAMIAPHIYREVTGRTMGQDADRLLFNRPYNELNSNFRSYFNLSNENEEEIFAGALLRETLDGPDNRFNSTSFRTIMQNMESSNNRMGRSLLRGTRFSSLYNTSDLPRHMYVAVKAVKGKFGPDSILYSTNPNIKNYYDKLMSGQLDISWKEAMIHLMSLDPLSSYTISGDGTPRASDNPTASTDGTTANSGSEGTGDAGNANAGTVDTGSTNTGTVDTGSTNTGTVDTGSTNTGTGDAGNANAGTVDTGSTNTGTVDTGSTNTGTGDAGNANAGTVDVESGSPEEAAREEAERAAQEEAAREEAERATQEEAAREEAERAAQEEAAREEAERAAQEEAAREEAERAAQEEAAREEAERAAQEEAAREEAERAAQEEAAREAAQSDGTNGTPLQNSWDILTRPRW